MAAPKMLEVFLRLRDGVSKGVRSAQASLKGFTSSLSLLNTAIGAVGFRYLLDNFTELLDVTTRVRGRLSLVGGSFEEVFALAQETGGELESIADLYTRVGQAAGDLGLRQAQLAQLTRTVSQAITISGTSAGAAQGAMIQLGQALGGGIVRAEEFNSILEGMPALARAAADSLGTTVAGLRQMVVDGDLTSAQFAQAILDAGAAVDKTFGTMPVTIGRAMTVSRNEIVKAIGEFDRVSQLSQGIALAIRGITSVIQSIAKILTASAAGWRLIFGGLADTLDTLTGVVLPAFAQSIARVIRAVALMGQGVARLFGITLGQDVIASLDALIADMETRATAAAARIAARSVDRLAAVTGGAGAGGGATSGGSARGHGAIGGTRTGLSRPGIQMTPSAANGTTFRGRRNDAIFNPLAPSAGMMGTDPAELTRRAAEAAQKALDRLEQSTARAQVGFEALGQSIESMFAALVDGSMSAAQAFAVSMQAALASVARQLASYYYARAAGYFAEGLGGDVSKFGAAAKATGAGALFSALSGALQGGVNRAARGVGLGGGGAFGVVPVGTGVAARPADATIVIEGGLLDMSNPRQADALARALGTLSGRRVRIEGVTR